MQVHQVADECYTYFIFKCFWFFSVGTFLSLLGMLLVLSCPLMHSFYYPVPTEAGKTLGQKHTLNSVEKEK